MTAPTTSELQRRQESFEGEVDRRFNEMADRIREARDDCLRGIAEVKDAIKTITDHKFSWRLAVLSALVFPLMTALIIKVVAP